MFAPAQLLDPLRIVHGTRDRYDCPDLATLDRHIAGLRRRIAGLGGAATAATDACRADIDRLLDRRSWLTLPVLTQASRTQAKAEYPVIARPTISDWTVSVPS